MSRYGNIHLVRRHLGECGVAASFANFSCLDTKEQLEKALGSGTKDIRSQVVHVAAGTEQIELIIRSMLADCIASLLPAAPPERVINVSSSIDFDHDAVKEHTGKVLVASASAVPADFVELFASSMTGRAGHMRVLLIEPGTLAASCAFVPAAVSRAKRYAGDGTVKVYAGAALPAKGTYESYLDVVNETGKNKFDEFMKYSRAMGE